MDVEVYPDAGYVQRLESGNIRWPHRMHRTILEKLCGRPAIELGFAPSSLSSADPGLVNEKLRDAVWGSGIEITELARQVGVDPKTVERWMTGGRIPYRRHRWNASRVLGIDESELWADPNPDREIPRKRQKLAKRDIKNVIPPWTADGALLAARVILEANSVDRRSFVLLTSAAMASSAHDWLISRPANEVSRPVGRTVRPVMVDDLDAMTGKLRTMDDQAGGGSLVDMVSAQAQYVTVLLRDGKYTDSIGRRLHGTLAELLRLGGWVSLDSGREEAAQRFWLAALHAAHTAGDNSLGAHVLGFMSEQAGSLGNLDDSARMAGTAVAGYKGRSPRVSAILHMRAARSYAMLGDTPGCRSYIDSACDALRNSPPESGEPGWAYWMDEASLNEQIGKCFLYLKDYSAARQHLEMSLRTEGFASFYRDGVAVLIALANVYAGAGEPEQACAVGTRAINALSGDVDSPRLTVRIKRLRDGLKQYERVPAVREFSERADQL
jgi:transcriptional regulator with XRE-family HTH domain